MKKSFLKTIHISTAPLSSIKSGKHYGLLNSNGQSHNCSLGKSGIKALKNEGDGATPIGVFKILYGFYRSDRIKLPATGLTMIPITKKLGWCDDPQSANYNQTITIPNSYSHETMMRDDRLYDICLVMDYNIPKRDSYIGRNKGSAIFFHLTKSNGAPTRGCIAIEPELMLKFLPYLNSNTLLKISI